jgi:gluconate 2-dehydrogenase gamma chain
MERHDLPRISPTDELSRRTLLQALAGAFGAAVLPLNWQDIEQTAHRAHTIAPTPGHAHTFMTASEAADVEAIAAQIVPSDDTPGAREAGAIHFIDQALATVLAHLGSGYRAQLAEFQAGCRVRYPNAASFAALAPAQQIEYLTSIERTPFFDMTRILTLLGLFTMPSYGGNRDGIGWALIGFEDEHVFQPPFGYYDRDYPGFVIDPAGTP